MAEWDKAHHFPTDVVQKMGELGLFGLTAPEEYGGAASTRPTARSPRCAWRSRSSAGSTSPWA
ncbi:acyl-CoA dehydrogenase family protein [Nocardioides kongjuensis]|uniref:acyl-CoA dehydrogenase family protein n=1 Tax=Nocardioides kongjuensis TaxID=349522 RepID=UPI0031E80D64